MSASKIVASWDDQRLADATKSTRHDELCERARRWLAGARRCNPVFSNVGSCDEVPDAIGWASCYQWRGSTVVECKVSLTDFHKDKKKYVIYRHPEFGPPTRRRGRSHRALLSAGYLEETTANMGDFRFFLCPFGVIPVSAVEKHRPDHGLLYVDGRRIKVIRLAPRRAQVNKDAEIRYLRFAIINGKQPHPQPIVPYIAAGQYELPC